LLHQLHYCLLTAITIRFNIDSWINSVNETVGTKPETIDIDGPWD